MKSVLLLALAVTLVAAKPTVADFDYSTSDWFTANWNIFVLSFILPIVASFGYLLAFFGDSGWFNDEAGSLLTDMFALPAYTAEGFDTMWTEEE